MLELTPKEVSERSALRINPAKTCQPIGAMYAALGVHKCLPHSHGSQGCCSFHRMQLTRHFKEPIMASTSSFTEGASVFGGLSNIKTAVKNVFSIYDPEIIAVHTTCLSETIGDDLKSFLQDTEVPEGKFVVHGSTPSYQGSHITGYSNMVKGFIEYLSKKSGQENGKLNIIPGFISPGDIREIKKLTEAMGISYIMFPDTSGVTDTPMTGEYKMYPAGGTKVEDIVDAGNSCATFALGKFSSEDGALTLEKRCKVPAKTLSIPVGIEATDRFMMALSALTGKEVPACIDEERGQLVDIMLDSHAYLFGKKVAVFGDPDTIAPLTEFLVSLGMEPKYVITGTPGEAFEKEVNAVLEKAGVEATVKSSADLFELQQLMKNEPVDLLIGNTYGKYIARAEDVTFVRFGFPILDRYAHQYMPTTGYKGAIRLLEQIVNAILERKDRDSADEDVELVL